MALFIAYRKGQKIVLIFDSELWLLFVHVYLIVIKLHLGISMDNMELEPSLVCEQAVVAICMYGLHVLIGLPMNLQTTLRPPFRAGFLAVRTGKYPYRTRPGLTGLSSGAFRGFYESSRCFHEAVVI